MSTLKVTIEELLVRTQQTQNQKLVTQLIVAALDELEIRIQGLELNAYGEPNEALDQRPVWVAEKVDRSNWYEIVDTRTGATIDKINGKNNAEAFIRDLEDRAFPPQVVVPSPTADDIE